VVQSLWADLLIEFGSWGTGIVRKPRVRRRYVAGSRYQATTGEDMADWKDLIRAVVNCVVCEIAIALYLLVVATGKWLINPITNPNPNFNHLYTWQYYVYSVFIHNSTMDPLSEVYILYSLFYQFNYPVCTVFSNYFKGSNQILKNY
jgi:hypothetical protein